MGVADPCFFHSGVDTLLRRCFFSCPTHGDIPMKAHLFSFIKAPIGYLFNFVAHFDFLSGRFICWGCETFCLRDGIQDDCWF
jgi:hypothetical protein